MPSLTAAVAPADPGAEKSADDGADDGVGIGSADTAAGAGPAAGDGARAMFSVSQAWPSASSSVMRSSGLCCRSLLMKSRASKETDVGKCRSTFWFQPKDAEKEMISHDKHKSILDKFYRYQPVLAHLGNSPISCRTAFRQKWRGSDEKLVAQDAQTPQVHASIMLAALDHLGWQIVQRATQCCAPAGIS